MLNYMLKDIKIQKEFLLFFPVLFVFLIYTETPLTTILGLTMIYIPINAVYLNSKSNYIRFDLTLPYSRKDVVYFKYVSTLLYSIILGIIGVLILKLFNLDVTFLDFEIALQTALMLSVIFYPLVFFLSSEKSLLILMYIFFPCYVISSIVMGYLIAALPQKDIFINNNLPFSFFVHIVTAITFVIFIISWFISIQIMKRKDV